MYTHITFSVFLLLLFNQSIHAECRADMPIQVLMDCVTIESSGENYQQWKENIARAVEQQKQNNINDIADTNNDKPSLLHPQ